MTEEADGPREPPAALEPDPQARREALTLLASIFVIAACALIYELLIATVSSYLLGSSVTQFSISIGIFIGAMGVGSHFSQRVTRNLLGTFILIELALGVLGGISVCLLFWAYTAGSLYWLALYAALIGIGALTGLELPLLTRLLKRHGTLRTVIAQALSFDYIGSLLGSLLLPLLLLPALGMARTAFLVGLVNVGVAAWNASVFRPRLARPNGLLVVAGLAGLLLAAGFGFSLQVVGLLESQLYEDEIVHAEQTKYQRVVVTRWRDDFRLFLDGNLQFSSVDEYRYHEALVHPAMALAPVAENVLLLGGGDGLAAREVLKYPAVKRVPLVDIDRRMTRLGATYPAFAGLNRGALRDPRVRVVNEDAYRFLERETALYDVVVADLPDPNNDVLAKLYSTQFYRLAHRHLAATGVFVTQASSPYFSRDAFWCIARTAEAADMHVLPYHAYVPSFGDWGFVLAASHRLPLDRLRLTVPVRYLTQELLPHLFVFPKDAGPVDVDVSTLDRPVVLQYYLDATKRWE